MTIDSANGNILEADTQVIAHGVAACDLENMATGLARQILERWPDSFVRFKRLRRPNSFKPGEVIVDYENKPAIAYLATQDNLSCADLSYVNRALRSLRIELEDNGVVSCALPKIGCGYGKLDWKNVEPLIIGRLADSQVKFIVFE